LIFSSLSVHKMPSVRQVDRPCVQVGFPPRGAGKNIP
jgi:hypothetical protein